jgi:hypothetical protein
VTQLDNDHINDWSDEDDSDSDEEVTGVEKTNMVKVKTLGPIPQFSRVYLVNVNVNEKVFECSCCNQQRMGMPCHHIASVCQKNESILGKDPKGFPLSSMGRNRSEHQGQNGNQLRGLELRGRLEGSRI